MKPKDMITDLDQSERIKHISPGTELGPRHSGRSINELGSLTKWLNTEQAAEFLGVPMGSLRNMTSNGQVPYFKLGRRNRYRLSDLHELLLSGKRRG